MKTTYSLYSFLTIAAASLVLMGCPNKNNKNSNIPGINEYGDRSQVQFIGSSFNQSFPEQINMPFAIAEVANYYGQNKMNFYFYEYELVGGANPCFVSSQYKETLIHNQARQRSFSIKMIDYASRQPQVIYQNVNSNSGYYNLVPAVNFQFTDRATNKSLLDNAFSGQVTVLESSYEGALVRFENVSSSGNCYPTPENRGLNCGARLSGTIRVAFCR